MAIIIWSYSYVLNTYYYFHIVSHIQFLCTLSVCPNFFGNFFLSQNWYGALTFKFVLNKIGSSLSIFSSPILLDYSPIHQLWLDDCHCKQQSLPPFLSKKGVSVRYYEYDARFCCLSILATNGIITAIFRPFKAISIISIYMKNSLSFCAFSLLVITYFPRFYFVR